MIFDVCNCPLKIRESIGDALPGSLMDSNVSLKWKTTEEQGVEARSLVHNILG
jgi:hypothetical protein